MTRITHRPQPSGAMNVDSAREPARRAVDAAIGLSARTEKAKEGNARLITSLLASVLLGGALLQTTSEGTPSGSSPTPSLPAA